jgi:redox-sensitive bicupin YhaK (pirin superfamily)
MQIKKPVHFKSTDQYKYGGIYVHHDAWFSMGKLKKGFQTAYKIKKGGNGVYAFIIEGDVTINGQALNKRDALGIWNVKDLTIKADSDAEVLLMDVPMQIG